MRKIFRNGGVLLLVTIPLILATNLGGRYDVQLKGANTKALNQATANENNPGECLGEDFIKCYENILEYVTLGEEAIKISDTKNAIIVIGLTRVGKSTFTQFVANQSNPLVVVCEFTSCKIIDGSGEGGDSVVSKTFVPNTVEDTLTNGVITPFYDMPGFDDTRNISVEIANSFFIQKVVKNIEKIKIVVVAKHAGFGGTETSFINLMSYLIKFTKNPTKFRSSIVLLTNFGDSRYDEAAHVGAVRKYLVRYKESLYSAESPVPNHIERAIATNWIDNFLQAPQGSPEKLQRVHTFFSPDGPNGTSIRNIPRFLDDCARIKKLLWNETEFSPLSPDDIGFTLSLEADLFLEKATGESSKIIRNKMTRFVDNTRTYLQDFVESIVAVPTEEKMRRFLNYTNILKNVVYQDCNSSPTSSPRTCIHQLETQLSILADDMHDSIFIEINKTANFLEFAFTEVGKSKTYDMAEWTRELNGMWMGMEPTLILIQKEISTLVINKLSDFAAADAYNFFINGFSHLITLPKSFDLESFNQTISELIQLDFTSCPKQTPNSPQACFEEIIDKSMAIIEGAKSNLKTELNGYVSFLEFASSKLNISAALDVWVRDFISLKNKVAQGVKANNMTDKIYTDVLNNLTEISLAISSQLLMKTENYKDIHQLREYLTKTYNRVIATSKIFDEYNQRGPLAAYIELILTEYAKFSVVRFGGIRTDVIYMIERLEVFSWYNQRWTSFHKDYLVQPVFVESVVTRFLQELYKDLQKLEIQVDDEGGLHRWRMGNPNVDDTNFDIMWMKFLKSGYIEALSNFNLYKEDIKLYISTKTRFRNWLNILLDYTLIREVTCPRVASETVVFKTKYVTMRHIVDCLNRYSIKPTRIVVLAENTFYFNAKFDAKEIQLPSYSKLFIMSRNVDATRAQGIDLSGEIGLPPYSKPPRAVWPGENGTPGRMGNTGKGASDLIGIYLTEKGSVHNLNVVTMGGPGGKGQDGGDGANSDDTKSPSFGDGVNKWISDSQCAAWTHGFIQVRIYPNNCNNRGGGYCKYDDDGVKVNICGVEPKNPGIGGRGGSGGSGSEGGFVVLVNVTTSSAIVKQGPRGKTGTPGKRGNDGKRGKWGAIVATISYAYHAGWVQKRCWLQDKSDNQECIASNNSNNGNGNSHTQLFHSNVNGNGWNYNQGHKNSINVGTSSKYSLAEFKPYINRFVSSATDNLHIFNRQEIKAFTDFVQQNPYLMGQ